MTDLEHLPVAGTIVLLRAAKDGLEVLMMRRPDRGSFSSAWVFPGGRVEDDDREPGAEEVDDARRAGIREAREEVGLVVRDPVVLSCWTPPSEAPVRIRTWFFVAEAPDGELATSAEEVIDARWIRPADALDAHGAGEWTLFPPTWMTLRHLSRFDTVASALASGGVPKRYSTRVVSSPSGNMYEWGRLRLLTSSLPWRIAADDTI